jgi:preprotein translocase subunit SecF
LRPILMTTAAMVVAMVPLLIAKGAGAASRFDIGLVIASGMLIGTMFTLFVTPAVYTYIAKDYRKQRTAEGSASPDGPARPNQPEEPKCQPRRRRLAPHPAE